MRRLVRHHNVHTTDSAASTEETCERLAWPAVRANSRRYCGDALVGAVVGVTVGASTGRLVGVGVALTAGGAGVWLGVATATVGALVAGGAGVFVGAGMCVFVASGEGVLVAGGVAVSVGAGVSVGVGGSAVAVGVGDGMAVGGCSVGSSPVPSTGRVAAASDEAPSAEDGGVKVIVEVIAVSDPSDVPVLGVTVASAAWVAWAARLSAVTVAANRISSNLALAGK